MWIVEIIKQTQLYSVLLKLLKNETNHPRENFGGVEVRGRVKANLF